MNLGEVSDEEAQTVSAKVDYFLLRLKQGLLEIPAGCDVVTFILHDGKPPSSEKIQQEQRTTLTLADLRDRYLEVHGNGTLEDTTLAGIKQHFKHWVATLKAGFPVHTLALSHLQSHVDRRSTMKGMRGRVSPATIKKEIITLRTCWNWGVQFGLVAGKFPNRGLRFAKMDEKPPFQTIAEVERKIAAQGLSPKQIADLWDAVFLTVPEINNLLSYVKEQAHLPWIYPMLCFAAHTGARRSEIIRAKIRDVDFAGGSVVINEKKRVRGERTTRRVPLTAFLREVLQEWMKEHPGGESLFCQRQEVARSKNRSKTTGHKGKNRATTLEKRLAAVRLRSVQPVGPLSRNEAHGHLKAALSGHEKWSKIRGYHVFRHSFASNCAAKGVDQRVLDTWLGHTTEIRKRYLHLIPSNESAAIGHVFG